MSAAQHIDPATLKTWLHDGAEIALLDVREHGVYGEAHLFYSVNVPYSRLEFEALRLVPRRATRIVLVADDAAIASAAAAALAQLGYDNLHVLAGGTTAWQAQGYTLFAGVNLPSKTFGELAEHAFDTPRISADALRARLDAREQLVVLDARPYDEYQKMSIPTALCCPNGELPLRIADLVPDESTPIVVNCAGRTRSIIGAQTLINLGLPNPVYALENGTQGWMLHDYALEHGQTRRHALSASAATLAQAQHRAAALAQRLNVPIISPADYQRLQEDPHRTTYLFDVRTPEEYQAGSWRDARHAPGGQLIQATDQYVATRGARLVLLDSENVRAPTVAGWLKQMGWEVYVLEAAAIAPLETTQLSTPPRPAFALRLPQIDAAQLRRHHDDGALLIDLRPSMQFRQAHITGARWSIRSAINKSDLTATLTEHRHIVLLADDARIAELYARGLCLPDHTTVSVCTATLRAWQEAGLAIASTPNDPPDSDCVDFLFFTHDRHSGNKAAARQYLDWETNLLNQIDDDERAGFVFPDYANCRSAP